MTISGLCITQASTGLPNHEFKFLQTGYPHNGQNRRINQHEGLSGELPFRVFSEEYVGLWSK
eukprot:1382647-Amorphochlora_amoeboformis.AAC.1